MKEYTTNSPEETKKFAKKIVSEFKGGEVLGLIGELGAGKTAFTQGVAEAFGITEVVNSPTFVLMKVYDITYPFDFAQDRHVSRHALSLLKGITKLVHVDAYRLSGSQELRDIGLEEYLNKKDTVVIIEWADKVKDILPKESMIIEFELGDNPDQRKITAKNP